MSQGFFIPATSQKCCRTGFHCTEKSLRVSGLVCLGRKETVTISWWKPEGIDEDGKDAKDFLYADPAGGRIKHPCSGLSCAGLHGQTSSAGLGETGRMLEVRGGCGPPIRKEPSPLPAGKPQGAEVPGGSCHGLVERGGQIKTTEAFIIPARRKTQRGLSGKAGYIVHPG